jgi:hypothetical protein
MLFDEARPADEKDGVLTDGVLVTEVFVHGQDIMWGNFSLEQVAQLSETALGIGVSKTAIFCALQLATQTGNSGGKKAGEPFKTLAGKEQKSWVLAAILAVQGIQLRPGDPVFKSSDYLCSVLPLADDIAAKIHMHEIGIKWQGH